MLFYVRKDGQALLHKDVYKLCPEFLVLKEKEVTYMVLVYDYHSPFAQLELSDRRKRAEKQEDLKDPEKSSKMQSAIKLYLALQYDGKRAIVKGYQDKIKMLQNQLMDPDVSPSKITSILSSQDMLQAKIDDLQSEIEFNMFQAELKGGRTKSLLEYMQDNRKLHDMELENQNDVNITVDWDIPSTDE